MNEPTKPQVKICGLTSVEQAVACAEMGSDAIGCVFYPRSPRFVEDETARSICRALPKGVVGVGVFVDENYDSILRRVGYCGLYAAQLHGKESPDLVRRLMEAGVVVIKTLFVNAEPSVQRAALYDSSAFLVEAAGGVLPGGNAMAWDWASVGRIQWPKPLVLAGGLRPDNVARAIHDAHPDVVDVSSGVEAEPGKKDLHKVGELLKAVSVAKVDLVLRKLFL